MENFATINDVIAVYGELSASDIEKMGVLLSDTSMQLRQYAMNVKRNLDEMIAADTTGVLENVAKSVTVDVAYRALQSQMQGPPLSQFAESALGYSQSGTYLVPGGGLFIKNAELKRLGLSRQRFGVINFYYDQDGGCNA